MAHYLRKRKAYETDDDLLWLFEDSLNDSSSESSSDDEDVAKKITKETGGRRRVEEIYPELVNTVKEYIGQNSAEAHLRRRDNVMYTNGLSLPLIQQHVRQSINAKVCKNSIHTLMLAPRRKTINCKKYKGLVPARVPPKRNSKEKKLHPDFHYTCAQVNILNEMAAYYNDGTIQLSVDNKNKVDVGINACSRKNKIRTFHFVNDAPNYNDHDFPYMNVKLVPSGYMRLKGKPVRSRSLSPDYKIKPRQRRHSTGSFERSNSFKSLKGVITTKDKHNRDKIYWPRTGPLSLQMYASRTIASTNVLHANFLIPYLLGMKKTEEVMNVTAIADGGPDWSTKGFATFMSMGLTWEQLKLDTLVIQCYAPGHSRFNPIERLWASLTNWLTTVVLPADMNGVVPNENDVEGWNTVLDQALDLCSRFWNGKYFDGHQIRTYLFKSDNPTIRQINATHDLMDELKKVSKTQLKKNNKLTAIRNKYIFLVEHTNRKKFQLEFIRCQNSSCDHCAHKLPKRENKFLDAIRDFGGSVPTPTMDVTGKHYKNFIELLQTSCTVPLTNKASNEFGYCTYCKCFIFFSQADKDRHYTLMGHKKLPVVNEP